MARIGAPVDPSLIPPEAAALIDRIGTAGGAIARHPANRVPWSAEQAQAFALDTQAAAAAWRVLHPWKRYRWALCAWRHGQPGTPDRDRARWSGFALYLQCWHAQHPADGHQPISPCSRRMTDTGASFWDFTP